ncbi:MAG: hypothetical protein JSW63_00440, partial [Ignavibacterium sp.]
SASSWQINKNILENDSLNISAQHIISNGNIYFLLNSSSFSFPQHNIFAQAEGDYILEFTSNEFEIISFSNTPSTIEFTKDVKVKVGTTVQSIRYFECQPGGRYRIYFGSMD